MASTSPPLILLFCSLIRSTMASISASFRNEGCPNSFHATSNTSCPSSSRFNSLCSDRIECGTYDRAIIAFIARLLCAELFLYCLMIVTASGCVYVVPLAGTGISKLATSSSDCFLRPLLSVGVSCLPLADFLQADSLPVDLPPFFVFGPLAAGLTIAKILVTPASSDKSCTLVTFLSLLSIMISPTQILSLKAQFESMAETKAPERPSLKSTEIPSLPGLTLSLKTEYFVLVFVTIPLTSTISSPFSFLTASIFFVLSESG
mmetsp:Transcript_2386/g.5497  ORF Transcript_2386/g.5497 Transcript_2386/m.5497 type:complete len:262 (+) Transcript_2386:2154-2939(+)